MKWKKDVIIPNEIEIDRKAFAKSSMLSGLRSHSSTFRLDLAKKKNPKNSTFLFVIRMKRFKIETVSFWKIYEKVTDSKTLIDAEKEKKYSYFSLGYLATFLMSPIFSCIGMQKESS